MREPDFEHNLLKILKGEKPERATLFELFLNDTLYDHLTDHKYPGNDLLTRTKRAVLAMAAAGYDHRLGFF